jgi:serine/threonine protein kinase
MGNCNCNEEAQAPVVLQSRSQFTFLSPIGKGGFGRVWKVQAKRSKQLFAMKEMHKGRVVLKRSVSAVMNERNLLARLNHPFLVNMHCAFQDREHLYLVMDYLEGGDLRYHLCKQHCFSEEQSRFFVACILLALEYLHQKHIMHRDLKPENIVLDSKGYLRVTDLGIARDYRQSNASDTSGTPGYMAPEVMTRQNHKYAVDFFALGVMTYEFMLGKRPYTGPARKEIREAMLAKQVKVSCEELPEGWSPEAADFVNQLIQRRPVTRLGYLGVKEVMHHPWMADFPWMKLRNQELSAPFQPSKGENIDKRALNAEWKEDEKTITAVLVRSQQDNIFDGYFYDPQGRKQLPDLPPLTHNTPIKSA